MTPGLVSPAISQRRDLARSGRESKGRPFVKGFCQRVDKQERRRAKRATICPERRTVPLFDSMPPFP